MIDSKKSLPCGHWNKDWFYGEGKLSNVMIKAFCRDCKKDVDVAPQDKEIVNNV